MKIKESTSICVACPPCGSSCSYLNNEVKFIISSQKKRVVKLKFDTSYAVCQGECNKECMTDIKLVEEKL